MSSEETAHLKETAKEEAAAAAGAAAVEAAKFQREKTELADKIIAEKSEALADSTQSAVTPLTDVTGTQQP